ncbi:MAG TPA: hypothetical protein PKD64_07520 [Pirellulaceae bacterium]|nr:hypothetical protein [Pirellulaceae bacterium]HMO92035.1 hypothetical protein [Pirellulaceae bacterium]HMP68834.1 hypothetical protein [Pirellulaceae bacterium]
MIEVFAIREVDMPACRFVKFVVICLLVCQFAGCGPWVPKLAETTGKVTMNGEPLNQIKLTIAPDAEFGAKGRVSLAITDANGSFDAMYNQGGGKPDLRGCAVGRVRIVLEDLIAADAGRSRDSYDEDGNANFENRIAEIFRSTQTTPLKFEIVAGTNQLNIELSDYSTELGEQFDRDQDED